jgi:hypothetical protein
VKRFGKYTQSGSSSHIPQRSSSSSSSNMVEIPPTNKNKTKHIMKISYINVNIYDKSATSQQNSD